MVWWLQKPVELLAPLVPKPVEPLVPMLVEPLVPMPVEPVVPKPVVIANICKHWMHGFCKWENCRFSHSADGLAPSQSVSKMWQRKLTHAVPVEPLVLEPAEPLVQKPPAPELPFQETPPEPEAMAETHPNRRPAARLWVHIYLHKRHDDFDFVPMLISKKGKDLKDIWLETGSKVRVRGRGSGHFEVDGKKEAPVPLMAAVTADRGDKVMFRKSVDMIIIRLLAINENYCKFCRHRGLPLPTAKEPCFSFGEAAQCAETVLADLFTSYPHPGGPKSTKRVTPGGFVPGCEEIDSPEVHHAVIMKKPVHVMPPSASSASAAAINHANNLGAMQTAHHMQSDWSPFGPWPGWVYGPTEPTEEAQR